MGDAKSANFLRLGMLVAASGALALGSFWLLQTIQERNNSDVQGQTHSKPDYYVEKFNFIRLSKTGEVRYNVSGGKLIHYPVDDSYEIIAPIVQGLTPNQAPMIVSAKQAKIEQDRKKIHLIDNVQMQRAAYGKNKKFDLKTQYLLILPEQDMMQTNQKVDATIGQSVVTAGGMSLNNKTHELHLTNGVHGTLPASNR